MQFMILSMERYCFGSFLGGFYGKTIGTEVARFVLDVEFALIFASLKYHFGIVTFIPKSSRALYKNRIHIRSV